VSVAVWVLLGERLVEGTVAVVRVERLALKVEIVVLEQLVPLPQHERDQHVSSSNQQHSNGPADNIPPNLTRLVHVVPRDQSRRQSLLHIILFP
jgi:hypothetical protein